MHCKCKNRSSHEAALSGRKRKNRPTFQTVFSYLRTIVRIFFAILEGGLVVTPFAEAQRDQYLTGKVCILITKSFLLSASFASMLCEDGGTHDCANREGRSTT